MIEYKTDSEALIPQPKKIRVINDPIKPPLLEKNRENELQFEACVKVFKEVYSIILSLNELISKSPDFVFKSDQLQIFQRIGLFIQTCNKLIGAYLRSDADFSERFAAYNKAKEELVAFIEKDPDKHFSFSKNFPEETEVAKFLRFKKKLIAGVSAIHSFGNDVFAFYIQSESLQLMRNKLQKTSWSGSANVAEVQNLQERIYLLDLEVKRMGYGLIPNAELILKDLKEGYFTEEGEVNKFINPFCKDSSELFHQLFETREAQGRESILILPKNLKEFNQDNSGIIYRCHFPLGLLKQWIKDSLENAGKAFNAHINAQKRSARFKSLTVTTETPSLNQYLQDTKNFVDNRAEPESFRVQLKVFKESEGGVDYIVFAIVDNGMGIEGERKKFEYGEGGYDGNQPSNAVGMANLLKSMSIYSADIELRARDDGKRGTMSVLRIPLEMQQVLQRKKSKSSSESFAS